ncbi:MAG: mannose-1-phosphate guanylyltransferase [Bacteroidaceae bacterium]|nr:mannose-1-phosphate guanylyltransferase [Bacteroidaceae bacterium]
MDTIQNNYCVIMAGGIGSRFWPQSRMKHPKQFVDFFGMGKSLLQQTYERFARIIPKENIIISTHSDYSGLVQEQLPELPIAQILHEPTHRGTAPSMAFAAYHIRTLNPNANIVMAPSDQLILDEKLFASDMLAALKHVSKQDCLVTVGIRPTHPETRYGYIQVGSEAVDGFSKIKTFTEKPEYDFARIFVESGEFFWNTGLFVWNVNTIISTMMQLLPEMSARLDTIFKKEPDRDKRRAALYECYESFPNISVDYAVIERASNVYMQIGSFGWADMGRWDDVYRYSCKDAQGNVVQSGTAEFYNSRNNLVSAANGKLIILQDLEGYLVNDTEDVLVICKKDEDDDFKKFRTNVMLKHGEGYM